MLLMDIGNTRIKCARWHDGQLASWPALDSHAETPFAALPSALLDDVPERVLVANVAGARLAQAVEELAVAHWGLHAEFLKPRRECAGVVTKYQDPERLGVDRWLVALAAWQRSQRAVCVVDIGTALTVDIVDATGRHLGGLIAPGLELMRRSLTHGTAHLTSQSIDDVDDFANNTADAISLGCSSAMRGLLAEVRARLAARAGCADAIWYLTGGGAQALMPMMSWPHHADPELVLRGIVVAAEHS